MKLVSKKVHLERLIELGKFKTADNELKIYYSQDVLKKYGQVFKVNPPPDKRNKMKLGNCYFNAVSKCKEGYGYVEGVVLTENGNLISHSWNVNDLGEHIDFTIDPKGSVYTGVIIPFDLVWEVGRRSGHIWYCVLPYLK